jgi:hypothetical protein
VLIPDQIQSILRDLEVANIPYALTGSLASAAWGTPRATYDADIVLALKPADVDALLRAFPSPDWYLDRDTILETLRSGGEFNAIHSATGTKIDFWLKSDQPVDNIRFARRCREEVAGVPCWILSPEDTILAKLEWIKAAPSERQQSDVAGIFAVQAERLDLEYLRDWADRLHVRPLLDEALAGRWS